MYILYHTFVALATIEVFFMRILNWIRLFSECFKLAGWYGVIACIKYLFGALVLDDFEVKSSDFLPGGADA